MLMPKMTKAILLPKSNEVVKRDWLSRNSLMSCAEKVFLVSSTSNWRRFTLLNAISKPEQRAEKNKVIATMAQSLIVKAPLHQH